MSALQTALEIAGTHHGVVAIRELRARGCSSGQIRGLVARGLLNPMGRRVMVVAGYPRTADQQFLIAAVESGGVISHHSAAQVHGIGRWTMDRPVEVLLPRRPSRRPLGPLGPPAEVQLHSTTYLPPDDIVLVRSVPATSIARTLLCLAGSRNTPKPLVRDLVDEAIRDGKASDKWLWCRLESLRRRGRPGVQRMESILTSRAGGAITESWLERQFLELVVANGLPLPRCQRHIDLRGAFAARVDFVFEAARIAIEVNGHAFHSSPDQLTRDAHRRNELQLAGYRVLDFTYDQIVRQPDEVAGTVRAALEAAFQRT